MLNEELETFRKKVSRGDRGCISIHRRKGRSVFVDSGQETNVEFFGLWLSKHTSLECS